MPEIEIDEAQAAYLEEIREALATVHLEGYGVMRTRDALQYLIDRHEDARDADSLVDAVDVAGDVAERAVDDAEAGEESEGDADADEADGHAETTGEAGSGENEAEADAEEDADADAEADEESEGEAESSSPLQQMMRLLDEHDDVWEEVDSSDGKYAVTLPDGSTEHARTQDDVRALLFKHYR